MSGADTHISLVTGTVPFCYVPNDEDLEALQKFKQSPKSQPQAETSLLNDFWPGQQHVGSRK